jgi:hypothetical protein
MAVEGGGTLEAMETLILTLALLSALHVDKLLT